MTADRLSKRQIECLQLVGKGMTSKQIGRALDLAPSTVDNHIRAALERLRMDDRLEAAALISRQTALGGAGDDDAGRDDRETSGQQPAWRRALSMPAIGGSPNTYSLGRRLFHVVQIALVSTIVLTAMIMTIAGLVRLLSRT